MTRRRRTVGLWLLIIAFAVLGLAGWQRLALSFRAWYWLAQVGAGNIPLYQVLSGGLWGLLGVLTAGWLLVLGRAYRWVGLAAASILWITFWIDRLWIGRADGLEPNLAFAAAASLLGLALTSWILRPWAKATDQ